MRFPGNVFSSLGNKKRALNELKAISSYNISVLFDQVKVGSGSGSCDDDHLGGSSQESYDDYDDDDEDEHVYVNANVSV